MTLGCVSAGLWPGPRLISVVRNSLLKTVEIKSFQEFAEWSRVNEQRFARNAEFEKSMLYNEDAFDVPGFCAVCNQSTLFHVDFQYAFRAADGTAMPNWRERMECQHCRLNSRMRASLDFLATNMAASPNAAIYVTEQITPMYAALTARYSDVSGREYLGSDLPSGYINPDGVRHEDVTRLSFATASFDHVLSFDVLEHVPDYMAALREPYRILKPGGSLLMTVPFSLGSESNIVRAVVENGEICHLMEPEYHGDPVTGAVLCYYHFGWEFLEQMKSVGFSAASAHFFWSAERGYLGGAPMVLHARRSS